MRWIGTDHIGTCPSCETGPRMLDADSNRLVCQNPACSTNQSSAPSPRSDVGENGLGGPRYWVRKYDDGEVWIAEFIHDQYKNADLAKWFGTYDEAVEFVTLANASLSAERGTPAVPEEGCSALEKAARKLLNSLPALSCENFHHKPSDYHESGQICGPLERFRAARDALNKEVK